MKKLLIGVVEQVYAHLREAEKIHYEKLQQMELVEEEAGKL